MQDLSKRISRRSPNANTFITGHCYEVIHLCELHLSLQLKYVRTSTATLFAVEPSSRVHFHGWRFEAIPWPWFILSDDTRVKQILFKQMKMWTRIRLHTWYDDLIICDLQKKKKPLLSISDKLTHCVWPLTPLTHWLIHCSPLSCHPVCVPSFPRLSLRVSVSPRHLTTS